jgi:uncharacterized BrkB/YihY/UPF0761 family membrane protein
MRNRLLSSLFWRERFWVYLTVALTIPAILIFAIVIVITIQQKMRASESNSNQQPTTPPTFWNGQNATNVTIPVSTESETNLN